jgi:TonB-dependent receptor
MKKSTLLSYLLFLISLSALGAEGYLRGKVVDEISGEGLFGASIVKQGTTLGSIADFDGNFSLTLPEGVHTIIIQSVGFQNIVLEEVEIKAGETTLLDIVMKEDVQQLGEVVITASVVKNSDAGVLLVQKKSLNTIDGISSSSFRRIGDSNLSSAMKRVTGVSVQGDKYVYVRGLGDRYTKTSINGMYMPGLDPDRNDVQIDIFPTGILENVIVYKTFTPNLPGSFTGGLVDIQTKAFPEEKTTSLSVSTGYNPSMHFRSDFLKYQGSSTDVLGFDNGQRDIPVETGVEIPADKVTTNLFDPTLGAERTSSFMNTSFSFTHRNQVVRNRYTWGYNALLTYRNNVSFYENFERRRYERDFTGSELGLVRDYTAVGDLASNEALWSGLISIAAKSEKSTIGTNFLHIQNGVSTSLKRTRNNSSLNNPTFLYNDILTYAERSMFNNITYGKHQLGKVRLSWANSLIFSKQYEPDYRQTAINEDDDQLGFRNGGLINRFWRDLSETSENVRFDVEYELNDRNKLKAGSAFTYRTREFDVYNYAYANLLASNVDSSDPNDLLPDNVIDETDRPTGLYIENGTDPSNAYDGTQTITAAYIMNEMAITERLKSIYGVRLEKAVMKYSGLVKLDDNSGEEVALENEETLNETNFLPSVSLVYSINDDMNLRGSFSKTLARPSFKEKSEAFIADPITGIFFIGNINTKQAEILNYDLRWEYFFGSGELISLSTFYKDFTNHIAIVAYDLSPNQVTPRNVGDAKAYGSEVEFRKKLSFLGTRFYNFQIGGNYTYTISKVDRTTVTVNEKGRDEYQSEVSIKGTDEDVARYRDLSMQAPYSINGFVSYDLEEKGITANLSYNVQGETLTFVSAANVPEVYTKPFHSLNFKVSKSLGEKSTLSLRATNLLDDANELVYRSGSEEELFSMRTPGRTFTLKYSVNF